MPQDRHSSASAYSRANSAGCVYAVSADHRLATLWREQHVEQRPIEVRAAGSLRSASMAARNTGSLS